MVTITDDPDDVDVLSQDAAVLMCVTEVFPPPEFTWIKEFPDGTTEEFTSSTGNINIDHQSSGQTTTSTLTIDPTDPFDTANYTCRAEDAFENVANSTAAEVTVFGESVCVQFTTRVFH